MKPSNIQYGEERTWFRHGKEKKMGFCLFCGVWRYSLHRDHKIALCNGGKNSLSNIQWICANCHEDKTRVDLTGRKHPSAYKSKLSVAMKKVMSRSEVREKLGRTMSDSDWRIAHSLATKSGMSDPEVRKRHLAGIATRRRPKPRENNSSWISGWETRREKYGSSGRPS